MLLFFALILGHVNDILFGSSIIAIRSLIIGTSCLKAFKLFTTTLPRASNNIHDMSYGNLRGSHPPTATRFPQKIAGLRGLLRDNDGLHNPLIRPAISWGVGIGVGSLKFPLHVCREACHLEWPSTTKNKDMDFLKTRKSSVEILSKTFPSGFH